MKNNCAMSFAGPAQVAMGVALLLTGCGLQKPTWQTYEEVTIDSAPSSQSASMPMSRKAPATKPVSMKWTAPEGWREEAGSGMRLATFAVERSGSAGTCTVVSLGAAAGGLESNVRRWLGQLQIDVPPANMFFAFLERQERIRTEGGFEGALVDMTELGSQEPDAASMLAALFTIDGATVFVKLTGPQRLVREEKDAFTKLCRSLRPGG
ncbi:MAG: hypothetical protein V1929_11115 [bacterium]